MKKIDLVVPIRTSINVGSELNCHQTKKILLEYVSMQSSKHFRNTGVFNYGNNSMK